jgi:hypothetical protein
MQVGNGIRREDSDTKRGASVDVRWGLTADIPEFLVLVNPLRNANISSAEKCICLQEVRLNCIV